jgi:hypothetical protein
MIKGKTNGLKSSEFLVTLLGLVGGCLCAIFSDSQWAQVGGPILAAICGASYSQSRATVKRALASAEAVSSVGKSAED